MDEEHRAGGSIPAGMFCASQTALDPWAGRLCSGSPSGLLLPVCLRTAALVFSGHVIRDSEGLSGDHHFSGHVIRDSEGLSGDHQRVFRRLWTSQSCSSLQGLSGPPTLLPSAAAEQTAQNAAA